MNKQAFTITEILLVALVLSLIIFIFFKLLDGAFSGASRGYYNLSILQEKSRLIAALKQDLRTLIFGGIDNIPPPVIELDAEGQTTKFEFYKVYRIDEHGRPLVDKIIYKKIQVTATNELFSITRTSESGLSETRTYMPKLLSGFKLAILDSGGTEISDSSNISELKKVRLSIETTGSELLSTTASVYSSYVPQSPSLSLQEIWCPNYMFAQYIPGAPIKIFQGGMLQMSTTTALGTPLSLSGANFLFYP